MGAVSRRGAVSLCQLALGSEFCQELRLDVFEQIIPVAWITEVLSEHL